MSSELSAASLSHILVVDAIPDNIGIFSQILASPAYKVQVLNSGSLAREWLRFPANFPDLILLNGDIPDVDGYQLCEQLKADDATCNIPVIFILDDLANRVQVFTAGGADYITYPLESVEIIAKIQHQLEWRSLQIQLDQVTDNHPQTTLGKYQVAADLSDFSAIIQELIGVKPEEIMANPKMLMDIIDMKQVEQRLALRETQLRAIFEQAAVGINQADIKSGLFIRANQCFCELLGYSEHELYQKTFEQVTHPEDLIRCLPLMQELHRGEIESVSLEKRYLHKNGMAIWTKGSFSLIYNSQGEAISHLAIVVDISDRRRAEEALKFSQARLESIATNIPGAIYSYVVSSDNLFGFEYISEGCRELFELEAEQVLADSKILLQQIHPDDVPTYYQKIMDSQADLSSFSHEWRHILPREKLAGFWVIADRKNAQMEIFYGREWF